MPQFVLIASTLVASWLGMQAVHESGHVLGAWKTRGRVARVVLHPLAISRTDLAENPRPLVVTWAGPIFGVLVPLAAWAIVARARRVGAFVLRFFAGFCLIANGAYLGAGSFSGVGDCGDLLRHGAPVWQLWLFGLVAIPAGLWLWHGEGSHFGLGAARGTVNRGVAVGALVAAVALVVLGLLVGK